VGTVLDWIHRGEDDKLRALVKGRAVVVASLLPTEPAIACRCRWPAGSRAAAPSRRRWCISRPCVRCSARGLIERAPENLSLLLAAPRRPVLVRARRLDQGPAAGGLGALFGFSTYALWQGDYLRVANIVMVTLLAYVARLAWEFIRVSASGRCCAPCSPAMSVRR
jgi:hypothetical protein